MNNSTSLMSNHTLAAIALLLIAVFFCRGVLVVEQTAHSAVPSVHPAIQAIEHGHYHEPVLGHFHPEDAEISDANHLLLHAMGVIENQMAVQVFIAAPTSARSSEITFSPDMPLEPPLSNLFRPPIA
ncbi:MAG: hypothetical protein K6L74_10700 [Neptuniibacter sp.]